MDGEMAEKLYQTAEDSLRASLSAWGAAFDAAQATGNDRVRWIVEEAAWTASRKASAVRNLAWDVADQVLTASRDQVRRQQMGRISDQPLAAPSPIQQPAAPVTAPQPAPPQFGGQSVVRLAPSSVDGSSA